MLKFFLPIGRNAWKKFGDYCPCTSFECPVSCIECGLVIYFTYDNIHMLKLLVCIDHAFLYHLLNCFVQYNVESTGEYSIFFISVHLHM